MKKTLARLLKFLNYETFEPIPQCSPVDWAILWQW